MASHRHARYHTLKDDDSQEISPDPSKHSIRLTRTWQAICGIMSVFFLLSAFFQLNDPDPYIWIPIYTIPAVLSASIVWKPECVDQSLWKVICTAHLVCCILGAMYLTVVVIEIMSGSLYNPLEHEEGRELAGLGITIFWLCVCRFATFGRSGQPSCSMTVILVFTVILGLLPLVIWSLCFVDGVNSSLAHCKEMFPGMLGGIWATS